MNDSKDLLRTDNVGDTFSKKYGAYTSANPTLMWDTMKQLEENFEDAFGEEPTKEQMEQAIKFIGLFLAEIGETCPNSYLSQGASIINGVIEDSFMETCAHIVHYRNH